MLLEASHRAELVVVILERNQASDVTTTAPTTTTHVHHRLFIALLSSTDNTRKQDGTDRPTDGETQVQCMYILRTLAARRGQCADTTGGVA